MVKIPSLLELSKAGVHLGHKTNKWSPQMKPYIHGVKNGIHIIDLEKTSEKLREALDFIVDSIKQGKIILFIGTKPSAKDIIKKYAQELEIPYVNERWLGGTLTNFSTISKLIEKFNKMNKEKKEGEWEKYIKKERHELSKELARLEPMVGGIKNLSQKPDLIYVVDIGKESTAIKEAKKCQIPLVAMVDTNNNPELIEWPIPANDDAIKSIELITSLIVEAIKQGKKSQESTDQKEVNKKE
ncbi:30S ribosomal protein S2 [Patescibacteria group bacterium]|nr:30S ribosomal protein S2 [Patescibacteria group bacterium]